MKQHNELRTWIDIDTKSVAHNYRRFRSYIGKNTKFLAVVKSNAYGHNILEFAPLVQRLGVDWIGVDSLVEGVNLRLVGVNLPILVLGHTLPSKYKEAITHDITLTIPSFEAIEQIRKLPKTSKKLSVHIKIDTGMHRQGFQLHELEKLMVVINDKSFLSRAQVTGAYTHFADAKRAVGEDYTREQIRIFSQWRQEFFNNGYSGLLFHACATAGVLRYKESYFDMVRVGIGCYGEYPSKEIKEKMAGKLQLRPTLTWKSVIGEVKRVKKGEPVGYDRAERLIRDSIIAVIPVGYWHGYRRSLSQKSRVLVRGHSARVLGYVSMDMLVVDVTNIPMVRVGDEVVLLGKQRREEISLQELADLSGTTTYEFITTLNPLMKRYYRNSTGSTLAK